MPTTVFNIPDMLYISPQLPLNFMETGIAVELDPPKDPEKYIRNMDVENNSTTENSSIIHDYSNFSATGCLKFAFPYKFRGQLRFLDKAGDDGHPVDVSSESFKTDFANVYDINFSYSTPAHHLNKISLSIFEVDKSTEYAKIDFFTDCMPELPENTLSLYRSIASKSSEVS